MESNDSNEGKFQSTREFLATCSTQFRYDYAGHDFGPIGERRGRGKFHTVLEAMRDEKEWRDKHKRAENKNVVMYSKKMLDEAKRRVLAGEK